MERKCVFVCHILFISMSCFCGTALAQQKTTEEIDLELCEIYHKDQDKRMKISGIDITTEEGKQELAELWKEINEQDKENQNYIGQLLDTYGWADELSGKAHTAIFLVIDHAPLEYMEKYFPLVKEKEEKRLLPFGLYPNLLDRILMKKGEKQVYGTQTIIKSNSDTIYIWPIQSPELLASRRDSALLLSIEEYMRMMSMNGTYKIIWDKDLTVEKAKEYLKNYK